MTTATKRSTANPTKADIIVILIAQAVADAQVKMRSIPFSAETSEDRASARGARDALTALQSKVERYLAGDINVLIR